jgi:hypothetical protein
MDAGPAGPAAPAGGEGIARQTWRFFATAFRMARPFPVAVTYGVLLALLVWANAGHLYSGNLSGFICLGDRFIARSELPSRIVQIENSVGYDGQFFFFIAHDPFMRGKWKEHLDRPAYRYQRILYPALSGAVALWKTRWMPRALVFVNWAALCVGVWLMAVYMDAHGRSAWAGAILGSCPAACSGCIGTCRTRLRQSCSRLRSSRTIAGAARGHAWGLPPRS